MKTKKHPKADLERKRAVFFQIGLVVTLGMVLVAFEWTTYEKKINYVIKERVIPYETEMIPITIPEKETPSQPKQKPTNKIISTEVIEQSIEKKTNIPEETIDKPIASSPTLATIPKPIEIIDEDMIFRIVENMPAFTSCDHLIDENERRLCTQKELLKYLNLNVKYPKMAKKAGISGVVNVSFVIDQSGKITEIQLQRALGGGCDEEAVRVVKNMPDWIPGKQRGIPVKVQYNLPVKYTLIN